MYIFIHNQTSFHSHYWNQQLSYESWRPNETFTSWRHLQHPSTFHVFPAICLQVFCSQRIISPHGLHRKHNTPVVYTCYLPTMNNRFYIFTCTVFASNNNHHKRCFTIKVQLWSVKYHSITTLARLRQCDIHRALFFHVTWQQFTTLFIFYTFIFYTFIFYMLNVHI